MAAERNFGAEMRVCYLASPFLWEIFTACGETVTRSRKLYLILARVYWKLRRITGDEDHHLHVSPASNLVQKYARVPSHPYRPPQPVQFRAAISSIPRSAGGV